MLVFVLDDGCQREAAGREVPVFVFGDTGEEVRTVRLVAGGRELTGAGTTAVQKGLEFVHIDMFSGGQSVDGDTDRFAVGLAEDRNVQRVSDIR